jgi:hypothetical protein
MSGILTQWIPSNTPEGTQLQVMQPGRRGLEHWIRPPRKRRPARRFTSCATQICNPVRIEIGCAPMCRQPCGADNSGARLSNEIFVHKPRRHELQQQVHTASRNLDAVSEPEAPNRRQSAHLPKRAASGAVGRSVVERRSMNCSRYARAALQSTQSARSRAEAVLQWSRRHRACRPCHRPLRT